MASTLPPPPPPPPPPAPPPQIKCAACGTMNAPGNRFCSQCGGTLGASKPAPAGAPVDIRTRVDEDRGVLKRLQLLLPGFRGYRLGEDIRVADSYLRNQVADQVHRAVVTVQECRAALVQANQFQSLTDLGPVLSDLQRLEGEIRFAEQGYSGISPALRVNPGQLDSLYEYDYGFVQAAAQVTETLGPLRNVSQGLSGPEIQQAIARVREQVSQLDQAFKARMRVVLGVQAQ